MAKIVSVQAGDRPQHGWAFECPGCGHPHVFQTAEFHTEDNLTVWWEFNRDLDKPTISPSFLIWWDEGENHKPYRCHSFIRDGMIQFLSDCTHHLVNQTVPLSDIV